MSVSDVCEYVEVNEMLKEELKPIYTKKIKESNLNGRVLDLCDLDELKGEMKMNFGDWEIFKNWIQMKRINTN